MDQVLLHHFHSLLHAKQGSRGVQQSSKLHQFRHYNTPFHLLLAKPVYIQFLFGEAPTLTVPSHCGFPLHQIDLRGACSSGGNCNEMKVKKNKKRSTSQQSKSTYIPSFLVLCSLNRLVSTPSLALYNTCK